MKKVDKLIGKLWMYKGKEVKPDGYTVIDGQIHLSTDTGVIKINKSEVDQEIEHFLPVEGVGKQTEVVLRGDAGNMQSLEEILLESIDKVRNDPNYINQAKQISNSANTLVNITKTKIMLMKL